MLRALVAVAPRVATRALSGRGWWRDRSRPGAVFPAPHSYTGEDVIELQGTGPGGSATAAQALPRARCTRRRAGRIHQARISQRQTDLAQAESVADLIDASTAEAARCAMRSMQGEFSQRIDVMVRALTELRVLVEATLDFPMRRSSFSSRRKRTTSSRSCAGSSPEFAASRQGSLLRGDTRGNCR